MEVQSGGMAVFTDLTDNGCVGCDQMGQLASVLAQFGYAVVVDGDSVLRPLRLGPV